MRNTTMRLLNAITLLVCATAGIEAEFATESIMDYVLVGINEFHASTVAVGK